MSNTTCSAAMLMTAGLGTRLRPFTQVETKALLPVLGIPAAQFTVDSLVASGVGHFVANVHHLPEQTKVGLLKLDLQGQTLQLKDESSELLGSGGGLRNALPDLGSGPFFKANADVISDLDWSALFEAHLKLRRSQGVVLTLALLAKSPSSAQYPELLFDERTKLITGVGSPQVSKPFWTGAAVVEPEALEDAPKEGPFEFVPKILKPAIETRRVGAFVTEGIWCDIGSPGLWLDTHFELLSRFEASSRLNSRLKLWKERFLELNFQIAPRVWTEKSSHHQDRWSSIEFQGPCYFGQASAPPLNARSLGPNLVLYQSLPEELRRSQQIQNGIAFGGYWVKK